MADRRPIVFYERLMENYDEQVAHLMLAKTAYVMWADSSEDAVDVLAEPAAEPEEVEMPVVSQPAEPVIVETVQPQVETATVPDKPVAAVVASEAPIVSQEKHANTHVKTGLGLSLDDILSEEASVAAKSETSYFED